MLAELSSASHDEPSVQRQVAPNRRVHLGTGLDQHASLPAIRVVVGLLELLDDPCRAHAHAETEQQARVASEGDLGSPAHPRADFTPSGVVFRSATKGDRKPAPRTLRCCTLSSTDRV